MNQQLKELQNRVKPEHKDLSKYVQHAFDALDKVVEEHRAIVAQNALAGINPNGIEERAFYEQINELKKLLVMTLEKTTQDFEHAGDKKWDKNFKDGVNL